MGTPLTGSAYVFDWADQDELARAMQKRARLYNGQPVLTQQDLIVIWDSIPRRVEGRMLGYRLGDDGRDEVELGD